MRVQWTLEEGEADWAIKNLAPGTSTKSLVNVFNWTSQIHSGTTVASSHYSPLLLSSVKCLMASLKFFASCDRGTTGYLGLISTQKRRCFSAGFPKLHPYWPRNIIKPARSIISQLPKSPLMKPIRPVSHQCPTMG